MFNFIADNLAAFIAGGGAKRLGAWVATMAVPVVNQKLGLNLSDGIVAALIGSGVVYIGQSTANAMHARSEAGKVKSVNDAMAVLGGARAVPAPVVVP